MGYAELGARILLAAVFGAAVAGKLRSAKAFSGFARSVGGIVGTPPALTARIAGTVVVCEAMVAGLLLAPGSARLGSTAAAAVLAGFTAVTGWLVYRRAQASCHCFGAAGMPFGPRHVLRNALLTGIAVLAASVGPAPGIHPAGAALAAATGCALALLVTRWDDLAALIAPIGVNADSPSR